MMNDTDSTAPYQSAQATTFSPSGAISPVPGAPQALAPFTRGDPKPKAPSCPVERWLLQSLLRLLESPPVRFCLWDGTLVEPQNCQARFTIHIADRMAVYLLMSNPAVNFGDLYGAKRLEVSGKLVEFMETVYLAFR